MKKRYLICLLSVLFLGITSCGNSNQTPSENDDIIAHDDEEQKTKYEVKFISNGGVDVANQMIEEGNKATRPENPTKDEDANYTYTFAGWYTDTNLTIEFDFNTTITTSITLYAKWTATSKQIVVENYTVSFNSNGGSAVASQEVNEGGKATRPSNPTKTADSQYTYTFENWYKDSACTQLFDFNTTITANTTLYAKWTATPIQVITNSYLITFDSNGGSSVPSQTVAEGDKVSIPADPTKDATFTDAYIFAGWYTDANCTRDYNFDNPVTSSFTLYAKWDLTANKLSVMFNTNGGNIINSQSILYGQKAIRPTDPTRPDDNEYSYEFAGWYIDSNLTTEFDFDTEITEITVLYAKWYQISKHATTQYYSVTFNSNGGTQVYSQEVEGGQKVSRPTNPTKISTETESYTFAGWYTDADCTHEYDFDNLVTSSFTLYAKWTATPLKYTVTYYNGTNLLTTENVNAGDKITYDPPLITDYTFSGWYTDAALSNYFDTNTAIYSATTLYAKYTKTTSGSIVVTSYQGYTEGIHIEMNTIPGVAQNGYAVSYKFSDMSSYTYIDSELIRIDTNVLIDIIGLKADTYSVKIEAAGESVELTNIVVTADDRSGYAGFNYSGVGAYNDNGTLKSNAQVVYVTNETKNTVQATINGKTYTGLVAILQAQKNNSNPLNIRIIGTITTNQWAPKSNEPRLADNTNLQEDTFFNNTLETTYGDNLVGLSVTYMDKYAKTAYKYVTTASGITLSSTSSSSQKTTTYKGSEYPNLYGKTVYDDDSYFNMLDVSSAQNVTIEGIGSDATLFQWGITWKLSKSIEVKNLTFTDYTEDACSFEGSDNSKSSCDKYGYYWVHNCTFNKGKNNWDVSGERDKYAGDGAMDLKFISNVTSSYNHFVKCKKTGLVGGDNNNYTRNITFHHNYYDQVGSRLPLGRQANMHFYNNYYYNCSTCQDIRANAFVLSENNYFSGCTNPQKVTTDSTYGYTVIKSYGEILTNCGSSQATVVSSRETTLSGNCKPDGSTDYTNFDTNNTLFYYDSTNKRSNVSILNSASELPTLIPSVAGAGIRCNLVFTNTSSEEGGENDPITPTGEYVEVFSDNFSTTTATKYEGIPTTAGLTYYTFLPDNAAETGTPDTYNYIEVKNNNVSIVDTSSKAAGTGDDGMSRTTYAYYMFDQSNQYTAGVVKYSISINLPVVASKWKLLSFIDDTYTGTPNTMLGVYSNSNKILGYSYGSTEQAMFSGAYSTGTYNIELVVDYDNNTAELSINNTKTTISNYNPTTIKGFYFMTSAGSQRSYSFSSVKIEKLV